MTAPTYLPVPVLAMSIGMATVVLAGLHRTLSRAPWPDAVRLWARRAAALVLAGWLAAALALALAGGFEGAADRPPAFQVGLVIAAATAAAMIWQLRSSAREQA